MPEANRSCKLCRARFYAKPNWIKRGYGKYCSSACQHEAQKTGKYIFCDSCGKKTWKTKREIRKAKTKTYFCSKDCMLGYWNTYRSGPRHPNWTGGKYVEYRRIASSQIGKPICRRCHKRDKRILLVHHVDQNRENNVLSNLVWLCYNCHYLVHKYREAPC
jgi:hypothetical protein